MILINRSALLKEKRDVRWIWQRPVDIGHCTVVQNRIKAVYTTTLVAGGWAEAVMSWERGVMNWAVLFGVGACSNTNFPTLKFPKIAITAKSDGQTDRPMDRLTQWLIANTAI